LNRLTLTLVRRLPIIINHSQRVRRRQILKIQHLKSHAECSAAEDEQPPPSVCLQVEQNLASLNPPEPSQGRRARESFHRKRRYESAGI
jgi:hypothetical protein